jgi:hypothetical protein
VVQQLGAGLAEQVAHPYRDPAGSQDRVDLALPASADRDQLGAMAHQLPQIPHLRRGDPRLRQPTHAQQIRQISGVAEVVGHPPVGERLHAQRVGQVHACADRGQQVRRPVPAIGRLQQTSGCSPARLMTSASMRGSLLIRTASNTSPC